MSCYIIVLYSNVRRITHRFRYINCLMLKPTFLPTVPHAPVFDLNPRTGVGSKMTPGFTVKACHYGEIEVTAMAFHENYSTGGRYLFMFNKQKNLW